MKPDKFGKDNEHLNNVYKKVISKSNIWITFTKSERVKKLSDNDKIAEEFKQIQLDIRDGKSKDHQKWFLKHCNTIDS